MGFQNFKNDSYCVGGSHQYATTKIYADITSKGSKVLIGFCSVCSRENLMIVSEKTIQEEKPGSFSEFLGKISAKDDKKLATNALKNTGGFHEIGANVAIAAASRKT